MLIADPVGTLSDEQLDSVTHTLNGLETHVINHAEDIDWLKLNLDGDSLYVIKMQGRGPQNTTGLTLRDPVIFGLYNSTAQHYAYSYATGGRSDDKSMLLFRSQHTGASQVYYLAVAALGQGVGTFTVMAVKMDDDYDWTFGHELGTRGPVAVGGSGEGTLDFKGDVDYWEFDASEDETYTVRIETPYLRKPPRLTLQLNGIYHDDPEYQSNPGMRENVGRTLEALLIEGSLTEGSPVRQAADGNTSPFATSSRGIIEFTAGVTGTYFFGVGSMKAITRNQTHTGTYEVMVTNTSD